MRIALITPQTGQERGGAENLYDGLLAQLQKTSHGIDRIAVPIDESSFEGILESYLRCYDLQLDGYDLVISTKAPTYMARHPRHASYLLHTMRVFYDMFEYEYGRGNHKLRQQRRIIHALDRYGLDPSRVTRHFVNGSVVFKRLRQVDPFWEQVHFEVLHHPPLLTNLLEPTGWNYIFAPGRLHRWKRVDLVIKAMKYVQCDIELKIAGAGEDEEPLRDLARGDPRVEFLGHLDDAELARHYAGALAVPFVPFHEDYGLVTIEAFRSQKPVITCSDSGEPTVFVKDFESGFVVEPEPRRIAERIAYLVKRPDQAQRMGARGFASVAHITWEGVIEKLLAAAMGSP